MVDADLKRSLVALNQNLGGINKNLLAMIYALKAIASNLEEINSRQARGEISSPKAKRLK